MSVDREAGFTLAEVLVAFVIVAVSLTIVLPVIGDNVGQGSRAQQTKLAVQLAQSKLAQLGAAMPLAPGDVKGVQDGFRWQLTIGPAMPLRQADAARVASYDVIATVAWGDRDAPPAVTLRTLRLGQAP